MVKIIAEEFIDILFAIIPDSIDFHHSVQLALKYTLNYGYFELKLSTKTGKPWVLEDKE